MNMVCSHIDHVLKATNMEGNSISAFSKSQLMNHVVWMSNPLSESLRQKLIQSSHSLAYFKTEAKPHESASEGFACNSCKIAIAFPVKES